MPQVQTAHPLPKNLQQICFDRCPPLPPSPARVRLLEKEALLLKRQLLMQVSAAAGGGALHSIMQGQGDK